MVEIKLKSGGSRKRGGWLRTLARLGVVLVLLLVVAYFVVTSNAFVNGVVLPRAGNAINADLVVSEVSFSPFSQLSLKDLKVTPKGAEPLLTSSLVRVRYDLIAILRGKIAVEEVTLESPSVTLVENADGASNLDPILQKTQKPAEKKPPPSEPSKPLVLDLKTLSVKNAAFRQVTHLKTGGSDTFELTGLNVTLANLGNGQSGKLELSGALALDKAARPSATSASLQASLAGGYTFDLAQDLKPTSVKGDTTLTVEKVGGAFSDFAALVAKLDCDASATEVKRVALGFTKAGATLAELRVSGPFDSATTEGRLKVELASLDRKLLNLVGATSGLDFGTTTINSTTDVELRNGGKEISLAGRLDVARFQVTRQSQTTPTFDLRSDYNLAVNTASQTISLKTLDLAGIQDQRPLLQAGLSSPMTLTWGETTNAIGDAAFNLAVTNLNLADWRAFAAGTAPAGVANTRLTLLSQQGGKRLTFALDGLVEQLSIRFGSNQINQADVRLKARGTATELKQFKLEEYRLDLAQQGQVALALTGAGTFDRVAQDADLNVDVQAALARLLALLPQPNTTISSGNLEFRGRVTNKQQQQAITGQLSLTNFTGQFGSSRFSRYGTRLELDATMKNKTAEIRKASGTVRENQSAGGAFEAYGSLDFSRVRPSGDISIKLTEVNQYGLRPFLEPALGDKKLVSVALNTTASARLEANGDAAVKGDLQIANLVVWSPKAELPDAPLAARVRVDTSMNENVAQLRQCQLTLTPTERAKNELNLTGSVDFSRSNAYSGSLKLAAESLDVTRYYDLFAAKSKSASSNVPTETATPPAGPAKEPAAKRLPFSNFTCEIGIGRLYLREVDIANWQANVKLDGGHIVLKPCRFSLNGAPVNASLDLDLGVPGYRYDLSFGAQAVPLAPVVNTFQPEKKDFFAGQVTAVAEFKGAGITAPSLQTNLVAQVNFLATNMNLAITNVRLPVLNAVIDVLVVLPDLIRTPTSGLESLLGRLVGKRRGGTWADELVARPIDVFLVRASVASGRFEAHEAEARSAVFQATTQGHVLLDPVLTNSAIHFPVRLSLGRPYAEKLGLVPIMASSEEKYIALPEFLKVKGTLGDAKTELDKLGLVALAARTGAGVAKGIGGAGAQQVESIFGAIGSLLEGDKSKRGTNAPPDGASTNAPERKPGLLDLFERPKK